MHNGLDMHEVIFGSCYIFYSFLYTQPLCIYIYIYIYKVLTSHIFISSQKGFGDSGYIYIYIY